MDPTQNGVHQHLFELKKIELEKIESEKQKADLFTKGSMKRSLFDSGSCFVVGEMSGPNGHFTATMASSMRGRGKIHGHSHLSQTLCDVTSQGENCLFVVAK